MTDEARIKSIVAELEHNYISHSNLHGDDEQGCRLIRMALERMIPKKPYEWYEKCGYPHYEDDWGYECPLCGNRDIDFPEHHCICGQALDWSEKVSLE